MDVEQENSPHPCHPPKGAGNVPSPVQRPQQALQNPSHLGVGVGAEVRNNKHIGAETKFFTGRAATTIWGSPGSWGGVGDL